MDENTALSILEKEIACRNEQGDIGCPRIDDCGDCEYNVSFEQFKEAVETVVNILRNDPRNKERWMR